MFRVLSYGLMAGLWVGSLTYDVLYIPSVVNGPNSSWFHKLKYLTFINMVVQSLYFTLCFIRAVKDWLSRPPAPAGRRRAATIPTYYPTSKFHRFCDFLYCTLVFPVGIFVVVSFWTLYAIDRELVYPLFLDKIIPHWLNHVMHTAPMPFILIDSLLVCHRYQSRRSGISWVLGYTSFYVVEIFLVHNTYNTWIYPVLGVLTSAQRVLFFAVGYLLILVFYLIGYEFNSCIWGRATHPDQRYRSSESEHFGPMKTVRPRKQE